MTSLSPESITCWHNDCSAGLRRPAAPLVPGQVRRENGWLPATVTNADGVPRTIAANRATRPKGSSAPVTGLGALPRTAIFATSAHVVTLHADIRAKRGPGLESLIQPQTTYSTSAQVRVVGVAACRPVSRDPVAMEAGVLGQRLRSIMTISTMTTMTTMVPKPIYMGNSSLLGPPAGRNCSNLAFQKGTSAFVGEIFEAAPERAIMLDCGPHILGSRVIALPG